jgi:serine/threonine protein kinase
VASAALASQRELVVLRRIRHAHLQRLRHVMHHKKYISFVLPWYGTLNLCEPMPKPARNQHRCWNISRAAGGDLLEVLVANTYLDDINARRIFRDVVSALAYLHRHRIIHRDIKVPTIVGEVSVMLIGCRQRERERLLTGYGWLIAA